MTADCIVITKEVEPKVLLIERGDEPFKGCWAFPGGFMNMDETTEQCAIRELEEERTYFLIDIPCHLGFMKETLSVEQIGVKGGVKEPNVTKDVTKNVTKDVTKELTERQSVILEMITEDSFVTIPEMSLKTGVATRTIKRDIENLQSSGILTRKGGRKDGEWIVTELGMAMLEALKK